MIEHLTPITPITLELLCCRARIPSCICDVFVAEIVLNQPSVVAAVREIKPTEMTKHMRVDTEVKLCTAPNLSNQIVHGLVGQIMLTPPP